MSSSSDEFAVQCTKQAIARAGVALGFKNAQAPVLDVLSDVLRNYIEKVASSSLKLSEAHGRGQPGIQDVLQALENLRPSATMAELREFAMPEQQAGSSSSAAAADGDDDDDDEYYAGNSAKAWHQPFPHSVPDFPVRQKLKKTSLLPDEEEVRGKGVPAHLPCFPPVHTYKRSHGGRGEKKRSAKDQGPPGGAAQRPRSTVSASLGLIEDQADLTDRERGEVV